MKRPILMCIMLTFFTSSAYSFEATLSWNASDGATGYEVYYGVAPGTYVEPVDVGNVTTYTQEFSDSVRFFALKAYNKYDKSGFSEEAILVDAPKWKLILKSN